MKTENSIIKEDIEKCKVLIVEQLNTIIDGVLEYDWTKDQTANAVLGVLEIAQVRLAELERKLE